MENIAIGVGLMVSKYVMLLPTHPLAVGVMVNETIAGAGLVLVIVKG